MSKIVVQDDGTTSTIRVTGGDVTKAYVDALAATKLALAGGTMTGDLVLAGDPDAALKAATKQYVDAADALLLPLTGGTLSGALTITATGSYQTSLTSGTDAQGELQQSVTNFGPLFLAYANATDTQATVYLGVLVGSPILAFGPGGASAYDWTIQRTAASVARLGSDDYIRAQTDPVDDEDLARKGWIDNNKVDKAGDTMTGDLALPAKTTASQTRAVRQDEVPPFPYSLAPKASRVGLWRSGTDYYMLQQFGGYVTAYGLIQDTLNSYTFRSYSETNLYLADPAPDDYTVFVEEGAGWASSYTTTTGDSLMIPFEGRDVGVRLYAAANEGIAKVEIDGDSTAANLLPTAQEAVDDGNLPSSALVENGGTLERHDRILNQYASGAGEDFYAVAMGLAYGKHTLRLTCTGYKDPSASSNRLRYSTSSEVWASNGYEDVNDGTTDLELIRWLSSTTSSAEIALNAYPSGGSTGFRGGPAHGYEEEVSLAMTLDGVSQAAIADGAIVWGDELIVTKTNKIHHPNLVSPAYLADSVVTYTVTADGVTMSVVVTNQGGNTITTSYLGNLTPEHIRRDGATTQSWSSYDDTERFRWDQGASFDISADDGTAYDAPTVNPAGALWQEGPQYASAWALYMWVMDEGTTTRTWVQDRSSDTLDKIYNEIEDLGTWAASEVESVVVRFCYAPVLDPGQHLR